MWLWDINTVTELKNEILRLKEENEKLRGLSAPSLFSSQDSTDYLPLSESSDCISLTASGESAFETEFTTDDGPWSLENCILSVFKPGTTHYLSVALLVNSYVQSGNFLKKILTNIF